MSSSKDLSQYSARAEQAEKQIEILKQKLSQLETIASEKIKNLESENAKLRKNGGGGGGSGGGGDGQIPKGHTEFSWGASSSSSASSSSDSSSSSPTSYASESDPRKAQETLALVRERAGGLKNEFTGRTPVKEVLNCPSLVDTHLIVAGWLKTIRIQGGGRFAFLEVNDGSCVNNVQVVVDSVVPGFSEINSHNASTGASVLIEGKLVVSPGSGRKQAVEVQASKVTLLGECDPSKYPLSKKHHTLEHLREVAHLRPRTNTIGAVARLRNALAFATHKFFQDHGFFYVHTPIITASDCEGAGELFAVSTLLGNGHTKQIPVKEGTDEIDFTKDFFKAKAYLTCSGQLNGENYASGLTNIYTFGPTFRAENSQTSRHLAEFWMIEPEMAFVDLHDNMNYAEAYLKYTVDFALTHCLEDLLFFEKTYEKGLTQRLKDIVDTPFARVTYTEAVQKLIDSKNKFEVKVEWGLDLMTEHERYLVEKIYQKPTIVTDYPKDFKAFYMKQNDDGKTVKAMDVLVPKVGEIIGGSQREDSLVALEKRMNELNLPLEVYKTYLDLRRFGSVPHSGFGLGFERLVMFTSGIENIRDSIPFPRYPGHAEF